MQTVIHNSNFIANHCLVQHVAIIRYQNLKTIWEKF